KWKFINKNMTSLNGDTKWTLGKWQKQSGVLKACENGFHASDQIYQAFSYVSTDLFALVECSGKSVFEDDKSAWEKMRVIKTFNWEKKKSVALAIYSAKQVIHIFEEENPNDKRPRKAIEAAEKWLKNPTNKNVSAAGAAGDAAWDAARAAW